MKITQTEVISKIKLSHYVGAIFKYGVVTVLKLKDEHERDEKYEECQIILNAINEFNNHWPHLECEKLPTTWEGSKSMDWLRNEFRLLGVEMNVTPMNMPYYIDEIKEDIKKVENGKGIFR